MSLTIYTVFYGESEGKNHDHALENFLDYEEADIYRQALHELEEDVPVVLTHRQIQAYGSSIVEPPPAQPVPFETRQVKGELSLGPPPSADAEPSEPCGERRSLPGSGVSGLGPSR